MANYPSYPISLGSEPSKEPMADTDISTSGTTHTRVFHSQQYYRFPIVHPNLTQAQVDALSALYEAGPGDALTLTYYAVSPAVTYTVTFLGPPEITANHGLGRFAVAVLLRGFKD